MTYRPPSLRLDTSYDDERERLPVPGRLASGGHPSVIILDGAHHSRGNRICRMREPLPLVGLVVAPGPLRVLVVLTLDATSRERWVEAHPGVAPPTSPHRLLGVTAQGRLRAGCLLVPDENDQARQRVVFDLEADEVGDGGLLVLGLEDLSAPADWSNPVTDGAVGVVMAKLALDTPVAPAAPMALTGCPRNERGALVTPPEPGYLVVNPGAAPTRVRLRQAQLRAVRVEAVDAHGEGVLDEVLSGGPGGMITFELPADRGPILVRPQWVDAAATPPRLRVQVTSSEDRT